MKSNRFKSLVENRSSKILNRYELHIEMVLGTQNVYFLSKLNYRNKAGKLNQKIDKRKVRRKIAVENWA